MGMIIPTILTYKKSTSSSTGLMFAKTYENEKSPLNLGLHRGRGAITDHSACHGEKTVDLGESMPVRQDFCQLPHNAPELVIQFPIKFLPRSLSPYLCNDQEWADLLETLAQLYGKKGGYRYQAYCQLDALFKGLPFWRNSEATESMSLQIINVSDKVLPSYLFEDLPAGADTLTGTNKIQFDSLVETISQALLGQREKLRLRVVATLELDALEEVFPSEEFIEKLPAAKKEYLHRQNKYQKSREYAFYELGSVQQAILRSTKIGAGLRWDLWNGSDRTVPVSAYGQDVASHKALRGKGTKKDFYSLLSKIKDHIETLQNFDGDIFAEESIVTLGEIHFIMANLNRGGVFNRESPKSKTTKPTESAPTDEVDLSNP